MVQFQTSLRGPVASPHAPGCGLDYCPSLLPSCACSEKGLFPCPSDAGSNLVTYFGQRNVMDMIHTGALAELLWMSLVSYGGVGLP